MKETYIFDYVNENEFRKLERSIKKYNMLAYKKLIFEFYPSLRDGNFLGVLVSNNTKDNISKYELKLPTDSMFNKVHGDILLHYSVYKNQKIIMLDNLTPDDILTEGHQKELTTYKGVMVSKTHAEKDIFISIRQINANCLIFLITSIIYYIIIKNNNNISYIVIQKI